MYLLLNESQWWDKETQEEYQILQLKGMLEHAYETVPYYNRVFNEWGIRLKDIQCINDLKVIPYLTKETIRENLGEFISRRYKIKKIQYVTTGGSTGIPFGFYRHDKTELVKEWAFVTHIWERGGYNIYRGNRRVILMGQGVTAGEEWFEYRNRNLYLSSSQLNEKNIETYFKKIELFNPDFIQGYTSSLFILARYILEQNLEIKCPQLRAILCVSENILPEQRLVIEAAFHKKVLSFYGHTEHAVIAGECEESTMYHFEPQYGVTEFMNGEQEVNQEDEIGEIVATGFHNFVMPFIRYRTRDLAVYTNNTCTCGRKHVLAKKIVGRKQEVVVTKSGSKVILTGAYKVIFGLQEQIDLAQFYQDSPGEVLLRIVKKKSYQIQSEQQILMELYKKFGDSIKFRILYVDDIERTQRGKHLFHIQKLEV
ncbi:capsular biosynthesis protein [Bacillus cereus]|uniref:Capsular biosynthesis protein n=1 Tax=Bacillus cereus TaxID=1396 RepID=A0A2B0MT82_BACCE|nr:capsular biosynthesis protein [Bacillus cereus]